MLDRRGFVLSGGAFALAQTDATASPTADAAVDQTAAEASTSAGVEPLYALTPGEAEFLTAVVDAFIPADSLSPSGSECGVVVFIDRQLAGSYGAEAWSGKIALSRIDSHAFFAALLQITMEGFFSDPIYGGNRDKASWRMIGYPGLPATYAKAIKQYRGRRYEAEPRSIADFL